MKHRNVEM